MSHSTFSRQYEEDYNSYRPGRYRTSPRSYESSSHFSDYISRPTYADADYISKPPQPRDITDHPRREHSNASLDYRRSFVEQEHGQASPYGRGREFVPSDRSSYEGWEVPHYSRSLQGCQAPTRESAHDEYLARRTSFYDSRPSNETLKAGYLPRASQQGQYIPPITRDDHYDKPLCRDRSDRDIYKSWGTKHDFMRSHGLKPGDLDAYEEASKLLDQYRELDTRETFNDREYSNRQSNSSSRSQNMYGRSSHNDNDSNRRYQSNHHTVEADWGDKHEVKRNHDTHFKDPNAYQQENSIPWEYGDRDPSHQRIDSRSHYHNTPIYADSSLARQGDSRARGIDVQARSTPTICIRYNEEYVADDVPDFRSGSDSDYVAHHEHTMDTGLWAEHLTSESRFGGDSNVVYDSRDSRRSDVDSMLGSEEGGGGVYESDFYSGHQDSEGEYEDECEDSYEDDYENDCDDDYGYD